MAIRMNFLDLMNTEMNFHTQCVFKKKLCDFDQQLISESHIQPLKKVTHFTL